MGLEKRSTAVADSAAEGDQVLKRQQCGSLVSPVFHRKYQRAEEGSASLRDAPLETATFHLKGVSRGGKIEALPFQGLRDGLFKPEN